MAEGDDRRVLGEGWALGIWRRADGTLFLGMPVDSGIVSASHEFAIGEAVLDALRAVPRKARALDVALHERLQSRLMRGAVPFTDAAVHAMIDRVVPLDESGLDAFITELGLAPMMARVAP